MTGYTGATGDDIAGLVYYGQRHVTSNAEINTPADMDGMKIRVPNASLYKMFPEAVGANATPMAFSEVYLALQQGVVDAQENPLPTIQFKKFHEVQDHITLTGHITDALLTIVAGRLSDSMSEEDYATLMDRSRGSRERCIGRHSQGRAGARRLVPRAGHDRERS